MGKKNIWGEGRWTELTSSSSTSTSLMISALNSARRSSIGLRSTVPPTKGSWTKWKIKKNPNQHQNKLNPKHWMMIIIIIFMHTEGNKIYIHYILYWCNQCFLIFSIFNNMQKYEKIGDTDSIFIISTGIICLQAVTKYFLKNHQKSKVP